MKVHSIVDVITNSSTEIFTTASKGSIRTIQKFLEDVLKETGFPGHINEHFAIYGKFDNDTILDCLEWVENEDAIAELKSLSLLANKEITGPNLDKVINRINQLSYDSEINISIDIYVRFLSSGKEVSMISLLNNSFDTQEVSN